MNVGIWRQFSVTISRVPIMFSRSLCLALAILRTGGKTILSVNRSDRKLSHQPRLYCGVFRHAE